MHVIDVPDKFYNPINSQNGQGSFEANRQDVDFDR